MAYKPITFGEKGQFDVDETIAKTQPLHSTSSSTKQSLPARARKNLRNPVAGTVEGEESLPSNVAPLVYPNASTATEENHNSAKDRNALTRIANYFDDRAQAKYVSPSFFIPLVHSHFEKAHPASKTNPRL